MRNNRRGRAVNANDFDILYSSEIYWRAKRRVP
jgi:hypothetical protein